MSPMVCRRLVCGGASFLPGSQLALDDRLREQSCHGPTGMDETAPSPLPRNPHHRDRTFGNPFHAHAAAISLKAVAYALPRKRKGEF